MKRVLSLIYTIFFIFCFNINAENLTIDNISGEFESKVDINQLYNITELTINGTINQKDIVFIRDNFQNLKILDLKNSFITSYSSFPANEFPEYGFYKEVNENYNQTLKKIILPISLNTLGANAFRECWSLKEVIIGENLNEIKKGAFVNCASLSSIKLPGNLSKIGEYAFSGCYSLDSVDINDNITIIEPYTFFGCSELKNIRLSNRITIISGYAFMGCNSIKRIDFPETLLHIGEYSFSGALNLERVNFNQSIKSIRRFAFNNCRNLDNISLKNSDLILEEGIFSNCSSLKNIDLSSNFKSIPDYFLQGAESLEFFEIPHNVEIIGKGAFAGNVSLRNISIPEKTVVIDEMAFSGCSNLSHISFPVNIEKIGSAAFAMCIRLEDISIPSKIKRIEDFTFSLCSNLRNVTSNSVLEYIGEGAFSDCYLLENFNLPNKLKDINKSAFENCYALESLNIPSSVNNIGNNAFNSLKSANNIVSNISYPFAIENQTFDNYSYNNIVLNVPSGTSDLYKNTSGWNNFKNIHEMDATIGNYSVDVIYNDGGYITYNGTILDRDDIFDVDSDKDYHIKIVPEDGYAVNSVMLNGKNISLTDNGFILSGVDNNAVIECIFKIKEYTLLVIESKASSYSEFLLEHGSTPRIRISSAKDGDLLNVKVNGEILTSKIVSGDYYKMDPIKENTTILIERDDDVAVNRVEKNYTVKYWTAGNQLFLESDKKIKRIEISDFNGRNILSSDVDNYSGIYRLDSNINYVVNVIFSDGESEQIKIFIN